MEKDYSLLRPFDLEAAKRGEKICDHKNNTAILLFEKGGVVLEWDDGEILTYGFQDSSYNTSMLFMNPLAWVEGRPVYRGDVLYCKDPSVELYYKFIVESKKSNSLCTNAIYSTVGTWLHEYAMTWEKPKTKREGWVNIYKDSTEAYIHQDRKSADENSDESRVACLRIEWEE